MTEVSIFEAGEITRELWNGIKRRQFRSKMAILLSEL